MLDKNKIVKAGFWLVLLRIFSRSSGFISSLILTRYLSPGDYGLVVIGLLVISFLNVFTNSGLNKSLIQKTTIEDGHINTGWTIEIMRGLIISLIIFILAPFVSQFFNEPQAAPFIRVLGISPAIVGLSSFKFFYLEKNLKFKKIFYMESISVVLSITVSVTAAIILKNAWALVLGQLTSVITRMVFSYVYFPVLPTLSFSRTHFNEMFEFGRWVFVGGLFSFIIMQGDKLFAGKLIGTSSLGLYMMAYNISNMFLNELKNSAGRVLFPTIAMIKSNPKLLINVVYKNNTMLLSIIIPIEIGIIIVAHDFSNFIIGSMWSGLSPILIILAIAGLIRGIIVSNMGVFWGIGRPKISTIQEGARALMLFSTVYFFTNLFGLNGIGYTIILSNIVSLIIMLYFLKYELKISLKSLANHNIPTFISILIMVMVAFTIKHIVEPSVFRFILVIMLCGVSYIGTQYFIFKISGTGPILNFKILLNKKV